MKLKKVLFISFAFFTFFSFISTAFSKDIPLNVTLKNGLKVLIVEDHSSPVAALQLWVRVGSADEKDDEAGISHVIEHMLFKGTAKRGVGDIGREVDEAGGRINAFTSYDETVYHITASSRYFDNSLDILSDMVINSVFDPDETRREIKVVLEELNRSNDSPSNLLFRKITSIAYKKHAYRRPVIGYRGTLNKFTRDKVFNFYKKWYVPNNMTFVVVGDVDAAETLNKIKEAFKNFSPKKLPERSRVSEPPQFKLRTAILNSEVKEADLELAFHIPDINDEDIYAIDLLANILGEGRSSRLYRTIKDKKGLVRAVSADTMTSRDPGLFFISADLDTSNAKKSLKEIMKIIVKTKKDGVNETELNRAKLNLESDFIYERETVQGKARKLGYFDAVIGDLRFEDRYIKGIREATVDDVKRAAVKYLNTANMTIGLLVPSKEKNLITEKDLKEAVNKDTSNKSSITKTRLQNGITLIVKENHSNPTVSIYGIFLGGLITEDKTDNGITNLMARMLTRGTKNMTAKEISAKVESMAGSLSGFSGRNSFGLSGHFLSRFFDDALKLYSEVLTEPSFPDKELAKVKSDVLSDLKAEEDNLFRTSMNLLNGKLYPSHPYGMNRLGSKESIEKIKRDDIIAYYNRFAKGSDMVLSIVGDVDAKEVISKTKGLLSGIKKGAPLKISLLPKPKGHKGIVKAEKTLKKEQTHIAMGFLGPSLNNPDKYPMSILSQALSGMGGRLFVELRDKKGLAYVVTSFPRTGINTGSFIVYMAASPENLDVSIQGIKKELLRVVEEGISEDELNKAKRSLIGNYEISLQSNASQASNMAINQLFGFGFDEFKRYPAKIQAVKRSDVKRVAEKYLRLDKYAIAIIKPPKSPQHP